jgi:hypothetical protein
LGKVVAIGGDPIWLEEHEKLRGLHIRKSRTYGTLADPLGNFAAVADGEPAELYAIQRTIEKLTRAKNMIRNGDADAVKEYPDCASLMLCAEALRRRRV